MQPMGQLIICPNVAYAGIVAGLTLGMFDYAEKGLLDRTHLRSAQHRTHVVRVWLVATFMGSLQTADRAERV